MRNLPLFWPRILKILKIFHFSFFPQKDVYLLSWNPYFPILNIEKGRCHKIKKLASSWLPPNLFTPITPPRGVARVRSLVIIEQLYRGVLHTKSEKNREGHGTTLGPPVKKCPYCGTYDLTCTLSHRLRIGHFESLIPPRQCISIGTWDIVLVCNSVLFQFSSHGMVLGICSPTGSIRRHGNQM